MTDHFFGGNTAVSHELDWHTRIEQYCSGYEAALAEARRQNAVDGGDFKVFFGIEQTFSGAAGAFQDHPRGNGADVLPFGQL